MPILNESTDAGILSVQSSGSIKRVLIANRGAIAVRIIRTLRAMGIESVAVYAEADRESLHVRHADQAFSLGEGSAVDTYLDQEKIIQIALDSAADAVHPGYGFLSENRDFVGLCANNDLIFLGPTEQQIEAFGLKHRARALASELGVPLLPGTGVLTDLSDAINSAAQIGYPLMLKSSAGGGGIGMQLCWNEDELRNCFDSVAQLSTNNFSNSALFLEKFVQRARHIEVQVFGDGLGAVIALGERDCSAQRRNQKVIEETPAPNLSEDTRQRLKEVAIGLVSAVNYRSAGTVEFLLDADSEQFYFLEVNTRLQVEHGVTEEIYGVDIVCWMIELETGDLPPLAEIDRDLRPSGHAIQARVYAEDPARHFQPSAGLLSLVELPEVEAGSLRVDHWIESGIEVSPFYDPMLAKIVAVGATREAALAKLLSALKASHVYGIETNLGYLAGLLEHPPVVGGHYFTSTLASFKTLSPTIEVLAAGTMTSIQDFPGRGGYWNVGVPPSGPFDSRSFRLGNRMLGNDESAAGLEITINGPTLKFFTDTTLVLAGASMEAFIDDAPVLFWHQLDIRAGQILRIGRIKHGAGARSYLLIKGGINCPEYLGSKSTFTLGQFGGHAGRALRTGDVLHIDRVAADMPANTGLKGEKILPSGLMPVIGNRWKIHVIAGPQGAPDFFSDSYIQTFFSTDWEVHYNSSRTGVRLIGPKPEWTRSDGGEAGMHPSNIHDNAYAIGTIDFTGDMPVILGPDGPSLGGFVCPATVITADLWKIGQLSAGDKIRFVSVTLDSAVDEIHRLDKEIGMLRAQSTAIRLSDNTDPHIHRFKSGDTEVAIRRSGDSWMLVEYGPQVLDIELRFLVHRLLLSLETDPISAVLDLTPGIRSLQVHFDSTEIPGDALIQLLESRVLQISEQIDQPVASRIVRLPLSWDDPQCGLAIEKYDQSVRKNAPWYPSNIEFIRRINGLDSIEDVKKVLFDASYLVMGLGDVYLGAPVATPIDPRHRLVTTKYNPARTWTAENSVGIGGSYLCVYGMEGPGGYQFVGRTLQMWNRYRQTREFTKPWLLRFFDQIQFYEVSAEELMQIRKDFPLGNYPIEIEETEFDLLDYKQFLATNKAQIKKFSSSRQKAFDQELARWKRDGQLHFEQEVQPEQSAEAEIPDGLVVLESPVAGSVWKWNAEPGQKIKAGDCLVVLESMKMEIEICSSIDGTLAQILRELGSAVQAGQSLAFIEADTEADQELGSETGQ